MKRHRVRIARKLEGVSGEFSVLFPAQMSAAEFDVQMFFGRAWRRNAAANTQFCQSRSIGLCQFACGIESELQYARRRGKRRERARMHLAQHRGP